jgi:hypothetical protein
MAIEFMKTENNVARGGIVAWIIALLFFLMIESLVQFVYHPGFAERSDFLSYSINPPLNLAVERYILFQKLHDLDVGAPIAVHAGDSSGYFGLMPDLLEQYLGGLKILNYSCCANQGWQGYLAMLQSALEKYPSLKYIIIYTAPRVHPAANLWRGSEEIKGDYALDVPELNIYIHCNKRRCDDRLNRSYLQR